MSFFMTMYYFFIEKLSSRFLTFYVLNSGTDNGSFEFIM